MKDFLTIFLALGIGVGGFMAGRNYGEKTFKGTADYKNLMRAQEDLNFTRAELETVKTKFQNIADGAESKKQEELMGQILQVMLADLGLKIANQQAFLKTPVAPAAEAPRQALPIETKKEDVAPIEKTVVAKKEFDTKKLKSYEWILTNSRDVNEIKKNLKNVEILDLNAALDGALQPTPSELESIYGRYRGRVLDSASKTEYGTLVVEILPIEKKERQMIKGNIKIIKNGQEQSSKSFTTDQLGYQIKNSAGFVIDNGNLFYQVYKVTETQSLAGYMYERSAAGKTRTIGSFVLGRTDQW